MSASGSPAPGPALNLDPTLLYALEECATRAAQAAGALLLDLFQHDIHVEYKGKGKRDPVTDADRKAEELVLAEVRRSFPDHAILSEEAPPDQTIPVSDFLWVVDPLDGTANFINRYPFFAMSIGVLHRGVPVAGAIFTPWPLAQGGRVLHARLGGGAFADGAAIRIHAHPEPLPEALLMLPPATWAQFKISRELRRKLGDVRLTGSIAFEMALVASGVLQFAAFSAPKIWDVAAGAILVEEAGGKVLARPSRRPWKPLSSFLSPEAGFPANGRVTEWRAGLLVGNPQVVETVARSLHPRLRLRPWRWLRRIVPRARATAPTGESPGTGRPVAPADRPADDKQHPPPPGSAAG